MFEKDKLKQDIKTINSDGFIMTHILSPFINYEKDLKDNMTEFLKSKLYDLDNGTILNYEFLYKNGKRQIVGFNNYDELIDFVNLYIDKIIEFYKCDYTK